MRGAEEREAGMRTLSRSNWDKEAEQRRRGEKAVSEFDIPMDTSAHVGVTVEQGSVGGRKPCVLGQCYTYEQHGCRNLQG